jgi:hypothetical protein
MRTAPRRDQAVDVKERALAVNPLEVGYVLVPRVMNEFVADGSEAFGESLISGTLRLEASP